MQKIANPYNNMGGVLKIWTAPAENIQSLTITGNTVQAVNFNTGDFTEIFLLDDKSGYRFDKQEDFDGDSFDNDIRLLHPKARLDGSLFFVHASELNVLAFILDSNEQFLCLGTPEEPLRLTFKAGSGNRADQLNAFEIDIKGPTTRPPYYILPSIFGM
jgi:hypothetical protein